MLFLLRLQHFLLFLFYVYSPIYTQACERLFPSDFPTQTLNAIFFSVRAARPLHLIILDFVTLIISGDKCDHAAPHYAILVREYIIQYV